MLLELLIFLGFLFLADYILRKRHTRQMQIIPFVSKIPIIGSFIVLSSFQPDNLHLKFDEFVKRFGKTFCARVFGYITVVTADSRYVDELLSSQKHIRKNVVYLMLRSWLGDGLLLSHGDKWQTMRKIITPTFHFKILEQFVEVFDRQSSILIQKLQPFADGCTVVDIYPHVGLATLDIIAETAMGVRVNAQVNSKSDFVQAVKVVTNIVATRFMRPHLAIPILFRILTPKLYKKQKDGIAVMHTFTENIIEQRRKTLKSTKHESGKTNQEEEEMGIKKRLALLDVLLESTIDGKPLSDEQIREEVNTFMFEGHDTTTSASSFCLYLLSRYPNVQQKLFKEIREHFGDDLEREINYRDLQDLNYLNCVVKEALRVYPPIPAIGRELKEECKLVDATLPPGTNIIIMIWQLLHDPDVFPEPLLFRPERHLEENPRTNAYSNIPFSAGPRNCIGQRFALYEVKTIIIKLLRNYELLALGEEMEPSIKIVLRSKTGVNFGIKPRLY